MRQLQVSVLLAIAVLHAAEARSQSPTSAPRLRIIGTNDFHGALDARPDARGIMRGGAAALAATIERAEAECVAPACQWILLDGGDEFQGTPESNLAFGQPVAAIFNELGYTAAALGNHEFDWGQDTLRARMRQEHYAVLGANVRFDDGRAVPWIRADTLVVRGPFRIGIIGVTTRATKTAAKASTIAGLRFDDPAPVVDSVAAVLRAHGANKIVVVAHAGASCDADGSTRCSGEIITMVQHLSQHVDAVVSGHTHTFVNTIVGGVPVVQARSSGSAIDVVDLPWDASAGPVLHEVRDVLPDSIRADPAIARAVAIADSAVAGKVSGRIAMIGEDIPNTRGDSRLGNLVADAMREAGHADFGAMNRGGLRASLHAGLATYGAVFEVQPFGNVLYKVTARGADMRAYLERILGGGRPQVWLSGAVVTVDSTRPMGARVTAVTLANGRAFNDTATYSIVINDFMLTNNGPLAFPNTPVASDPLSMTDLEAFIAYLEKLPQPVLAPTDTRILVVGG